MLKSVIFLATLIFVFSLPSQAKTSGKKRTISKLRLTLSYAQFKRLSKENKKRYIGALRQVVHKFEKSLKHQKYSHMLPAPTSPFLNYLFPYANAMSTDTHCLVGGLAFEKEKGSTNCSTRGRACTEPRTADDFRCGIVYANVCVKREPTDKISERCFKKAKNKGIQLTPALYAKYGKTLEKINRELCAGRDTDPCMYLNERLDQVNRTFANEADSDDIADVPDQAETEEEPEEAPAAAPAEVETPAAAASPQLNCTPGFPCPTRLKVLASGSTFKDSISSAYDFCKTGNLTIKDKRGVQMEFSTKDGKLCREIKVPNREVVGRFNNYNAILGRSLHNQDCQSDISLCAKTLHEPLDDRSKVKVRDEYQKTNRFNQRLQTLRANENANFHQKMKTCTGVRKECPEQAVKKKCDIPLQTWNTSSSCPGRRLIKNGDKLREVLKYALENGQLPNDRRAIDLGNQRNSNSGKTRKQKHQRYCREIFPNDRKKCEGTYLNTLKNLKYHFDNFYYTSEPISFKNFDDFIEQTRAAYATETGRDSIPSKCGEKKMKECLDTIDTLVPDPSLVENSTKPRRKTKPVCGDDLISEIKNETNSDRYNSQHLYDAKANKVGTVGISGNHIILQSVPKDRAKLELFLDGKSLRAREVSGDNIVGQMTINDDACSKFPDKTCPIPEDSQGGIGLRGRMLNLAANNGCENPGSIEEKPYGTNGATSRCAGLGSCPGSVVSPESNTHR